MQEEYLPTDTTMEDNEEVAEEDKSVEAFWKDKKYIVFESCLLKLLVTKQCSSCGQEVELNTSVRGSYIVGS